MTFVHTLPSLTEISKFFSLLKHLRTKKKKKKDIYIYIYLVIYAIYVCIYIHISLDGDKFHKFHLAAKNASLNELY